MACTFPADEGRVDQGREGWTAVSGLVLGAAALFSPPVATGAFVVGLISLGMWGCGIVSREDAKDIRLPDVRDASVHDLNTFQAQLATFTRSLVLIEDWLAISRRNPGCFRVIDDVRDSEWRRKLDILAVYPLNAAAMAEVMAGRMRGADVRAKDVSRTFARAAGLYVSFAEGKNFTTRKLVLEQLRRAAEAVRHRPLPIATIPTTDAALRLTTKRGFQDLKSGPPAMGSVCVCATAMGTSPSRDARSPRFAASMRAPTSRSLQTTGCGRCVRHDQIRPRVRDPSAALHVACRLSAPPSRTCPWAFAPASNR